jgi:hypothetical protein
MPNQTGGLFETLTAAASIATQNLAFQNTFLDVVYMEHKPMHGALGETLKINIPTVDAADTVDIGNGPLQPSDTDHDTATIQITRNLSNSFIIRDWDESRTLVDLSNMYMKPRMESMMRAANQILANLVTTTNFPTYTLISGAGADLFQRADLTTAWRNLAAAGVPVEDLQNFYFVTTPTAFANMLGDTNFINESIVGINAAQMAQQMAKVSLQLGANVRFDQHLARYNAGKEPGVLLHKFAIGAVTAQPPVLPADWTGGVQTTTLFPRPGVGIRLQAGYSLRDQGILVNLGFMFGCSVVRADHGSLVETA